MSGRVSRPGLEEIVGNAMERIRALEADPGCCAGSGFEEAVAIRDRACSWYGLGDGSILDDSAVHNFGTAPDATLFIAQAEDGDPGTDGPSLEDEHPWPLAQDTGSYRGFLKDYCDFGGYEITPQVAALDVLDTSAESFTVNGWFRWDGYSYRCLAAVDQYGPGGLWGKQSTSGVGIFVYTEGDIVASGDPPSLPVLHCVVQSGGDSVDIVFGSVDDGLWHMATQVFDIGTGLVSFYVDGGLIGSDTYTGGTINIDLHIGSVNFGGGTGANYGTWNGLIDEVGVWCGEALTAGDVATLYEAGIPPAPVTAADIDSGIAPCGYPLVADGDGHATWGNSCADTGAFVLPAAVTAQDIADALIALGLVTQTP